MATPEATTAAPNSTALPAEVSTVVPDSTETKPATETPAAEAPATETKPATETPAPTESAPPATETPVVAEKAPDVDVPVEKKTTPIEELWALAQAHGHPEIWGVTLADPATHVPTQVILQKYLNAYDGDLAKSKDTLTKTLDWRAKMKPVELLKKKFNRNKFAGLGYTTVYGDADPTADPETREVFTWNIYGSVKNLDETFGNLAEFIEWRVALMEDALQALGIDKATKPITATYDPYKILQVHDYKSISFLRQSAVVKAASTETIKIFAQNYPELLKEKFFVNVPAFMGFIYTFMKLFVAAKTIKKFHPMSNGANLAREMVTSSKVKGLGEMLPEEYGGKGAALNSAGRQPSLEDEPAAQ
ncbi:Phosphatidylinositol transfer protein SFH5 [Fonsecaea pedrosoi]|nr:Phosphatidylinositol transfer protein SFH5 [Fonsecaea pedrosoi]